jgi:hypothetical protein
MTMACLRCERIWLAVPPAPRKRSLILLVTELDGLDAAAALLRIQDDLA